MSRILKIHFIRGLAGMLPKKCVNEEVFAMKSDLDNYDFFYTEIKCRRYKWASEMNYMYYEDAEGDRVTIRDDKDFQIFKQQNINKVFLALK